MSDFNFNIVTHLESQTLGTLFKNTNPEDPNIYVLFSGHAVSSGQTNCTFLTFDDLTLNGKILNVNIWIDVSIAIIEDPSYVDFPVTTQLIYETEYQENEDVTFFSGYELNNSLARPVTSNIRDPNYRYPQKTVHFFYPESILLREAQGSKGASGSPVINSSNQVIAIASKIIGDQTNSPRNLVCTKMNMIYLYLFDTNYGLIPKFYDAYMKDPDINNSFILLNKFRNTFNIVMCHTFFSFRSSRDAATIGVNLNKTVNGNILSNRITGINNNTYNVVNYTIKDDPNVTYFTTLFDFSELLNDYFKTKNRVIIKFLTYTDRTGLVRTIDLGTDSFAPYYVNGEPSAPVTVQYYNFGPAGDDGLNMVYSPLKTVVVQPVLVDDMNGGKRWSSQMPVIFTKTSSRGNAVMQMSLYNTTIGGGPFMINYATGPLPLWASQNTQSPFIF